MDSKVSISTIRSATGVEEGGGGDEGVDEGEVVEGHRGPRVVFGMKGHVPRQFPVEVISLMPQRFPPK